MKLYTEKERSEMILLVECEGNWSKYTNPKYGTHTYSLANKDSRASDSTFGSANFFRRWLKNELEKNPEIKKDITTEGYKFLNGEEIK